MRCALIAACASGALGGMVIAPGAPVAAKGVPRCHKGEVKRTIVYRKKVGGRARKVTGCVPRSLPATATASAAGLGQIRAFADRFAPASYMRLLKTPAGRRLRAADAATDAALARTAGFGVTAQAASTNHPNQQTMDSPPGTTSIIYGEGVTSLDTQYEVGALFEATTETTSNRIGGQSSKRYKFLKSKHLMNRCPGADGIAHGTLSASLREVTSIDTGDGRHVTRTQETPPRHHAPASAQHQSDNRLLKCDKQGAWFVDWRFFSDRSPRFEAIP